MRADVSCPIWRAISSRSTTNGKRQELTLFANDLQPITVVIMLDRSSSMRGNFSLVEKAAEEFVSVMLPADKARIDSFSDRIQVDPRAKLDGKMHSLTLRLGKEGLTARARKSYLATTPRP